MLIQETDYFHGNVNKRFPIFCMDHKDNAFATGSINGELKIYQNSGHKTYNKHLSTILCVKFDPYTDYLASGSDDHSVCIFEQVNMEYEFCMKIEKHKLDVSGVMWTRHHLVSCGYDGRIILYQKGTFDVLKTLTLFESCRGLVIDPLCEYVICQGDNKIKIFNDSFEEIQTVENIFNLNIREAFFSRLDWSPDGQFVAVPLADNNKTHSIEVLNRCSFERAFSLIGHCAPCEVVRFYPKMLSRENKTYVIVAVGSQDKSISFWSSLNEKPFLLIKNAFDQPILDMLWIDKVLYACSYDGNVKKYAFTAEEIGENMDYMGLGNMTQFDITFNQENMKILEDGIYNVICPSKTDSKDEYKDQKIKKLTEKNEITQCEIGLKRDIDTKIQKDKDMEIKTYSSQSEVELKDVNNLKKQKKIPMNVEDHSCKNEFKQEVDLQKQIEDNKKLNLYADINEFITEEDLKKQKHKIEMPENIAKKKKKNENSKKQNKLSNKDKDNIKRIKPVYIAPIPVNNEKDSTETRELKLDQEKINLLEANNSIVIDKNREAFVLFNPKNHANLDYESKILDVEVLIQIQDYLVKITDNKNVNVMRNNAFVYSLRYDNIKLFAGGNKYIAFVVSHEFGNSLIVHVLQTGNLHIPIISSGEIYMIDILKSNLLMLKDDSSVEIIDLKKLKQTIKIKLPLTEKLYNIKLDSKYTVLALYESGIYFLNSKLKNWIKKDHNYKSIFLHSKNETTLEIIDEDETINLIEYRFLVQYLIGDIDELIKITKRAVKLALRMRSFDTIHFNKFSNMFMRMIKCGQKRSVYLLLEEMNGSKVLQPFVMDVMGLIRNKLF